MADETQKAAHASAADVHDAPVTFSTFVLGLSTQALVHLGEIADPVTAQTSTDLVAAKQVIDLLGMLVEKTQGNLDEAERGLVESMLYDLRMRYVDLMRRGAKEAT